MTETPSAVRFFAFEQPGLPRSTRQKLERYRDELIGYLETATIENLRFRQGQIQGVRDALGILEQVEKEMRN